MDAYRTFRDTVMEEAKQLKITPKFFLFAIAGTAEWQANALSKEQGDENIFSHFLSSLAVDMEESARTQLKSKNPHSREAGETVLSPFLWEHQESFNLQDVSREEIERYLPNREVRILDVLAIRETKRDVEKLRKKFGRKSIVEIIIEAYPDLVRQAITFSIILDQEPNIN
ncbi:hypothetical protein V9K67_21865 [Paraflavisolibacter sp. H34]|uniref:hypothetical protein n=1 Tax=Huijunlia imazamoxiresistens TaxID=3127457 RepID=UPI0030195564